MPFLSKAQQGYLHANPEVLGKDKLAEWDAATKGKDLPERIHPKNKPSYKLAYQARKKKI